MLRLIHVIAPRHANALRVVLDSNSGVESGVCLDGFQQAGDQPVAGHAREEEKKRKKKEKKGSMSERRQRQWSHQQTEISTEKERI